jgi:Rod binding domain-containing protein
MNLDLVQKNPALMTTDTRLSPRQLEQIDSTAREFEAMFLTEMIRPIYDGIEVDPVFGGGKTEEIFRGFMLEEYGKMMAATGQLGIADSVREQMIAMQSGINPENMAQNMLGNSQGPNKTQDQSNNKGV